MEQVVGIEPTSSAWKAEVLPLNYTCEVFLLTIIDYKCFYVFCQYFFLNFFLKQLQAFNPFSYKQAFTNPTNNGAGLLGLDFNSGWNCPAIK